jgi:exopolysaccharide production protein ExoZ
VRQGRTPLAPLALVAGVIALVCGGGAIGMTLPAEAQYGLVRAAVFGGSASLIIYGAVGMELAGKLTTPRWLAFLGDASYSTYLTHMYMLWLIADAWLPSSNSLMPSAWVKTLIGVVACTAAGVTCHLLVERPLLRASQKLLTPGAVGAMRPAPAA